MEAKDFTWNSLAGRMLIVVFLGLLLLAGYYTFGSPPTRSPARLGQGIFEMECQSCHTLGGGSIVGPDLQGLFERRDRDWVARFIASPDWLIAEGDPLALEMLAEYNGVEMPNQALSEQEVELIMVYLENQGELTQAAPELPTGDSSSGEILFTGQKTLENGGLACMACHDVNGVGDFGGGNLGPDLTHVYDRYGEAGLASAMQNISFPTMKNLYSERELNPQEIADLVVYFHDADRAPEEGIADSITGIFWGSGIVVALVLFVFMSPFWPRQRKSQIERLRLKADADSKGRS